MEINSVKLNDLIFNGLTQSVEINGKDDSSTSEIRMLRIPTSAQLHDIISRVVNCFFPLDRTDDMVRYELKVSTNNLVSMLCLQLAASSRLDRHKLLADIRKGDYEILTKVAIKSVEKLAEIQFRSDNTIEKYNIDYDQYVANILYKQTPEVIDLVELKNHLFMFNKLEDQVYPIEQIMESMLKFAYRHFVKFNINDPTSNTEPEEILNQLTHLLSCCLFVLWSKAHGEMIEVDLWNYWYRFIIISGLICVLLDAYYRRSTKKSAILNIISKKFEVEQLSDVFAIIDKEQLNELSSEDMAVVQTDNDSRDDTLINVDIETFLTQAIQDMNGILKVVSEEYKIVLLAENENTKRNSIIEHDKEKISSENEEIKNNAETNKLYIVKCALGFQINRDNDDSRYDSFARLTLLHVFDLDMRDVAEMISQQTEIEWPDKRINKTMIVNLLRNTGNDEQKPKGATSRQNIVQRIKKEWTADDDMVVVTALEKFKLHLVHLRRYFQYSDDLSHILECKSSTSVTPNISSLASDDFPTFCSQKIWKSIQTQPEAKQALKIYHNHRGGWEIFESFSVKLVRLGFGKRGTGRIVAASDDRNTVRVILHIGSHNTYMLYRSKAHAGVVAAYNGSEEKRLQPNLTFVDYLRLRPNVFNVSTRFTRT